MRNGIKRERENKIPSPRTLGNNGSPKCFFFFCVEYVTSFHLFIFCSYTFITASVNIYCKDQWKCWVNAVARRGSKYCKMVSSSIHLWNLHIVVFCTQFNTLTKPGRKQRETAFNIAFFISSLKRRVHTHTPYPLLLQWTMCDRIPFPALHVFGQ